MQFNSVNSTISKFQELLLLRNRIVNLSFLTLIMWINNIFDHFCYAGVLSRHIESKLQVICEILCTYQWRRKQMEMEGGG